MDSRAEIDAQYRTLTNLDTRIRVHERFSINAYPWMRWVFDHFVLPPAVRVLEVGCGPANLWRENASRLDPAWQLLLSDHSTGMLTAARGNVAGLPPRFSFARLAAEALPSPDASFDALIANHMLYYAADLDRTLTGFRRVLRPGGRLYATTNGRAHLREIDDLILVFRGGLRPVATVTERFNLENGGDYLARHFDCVTLDRQPNALLVDDPAALAEFALSMTAAGIPAEARPAFLAYVAAEIRARSGAFRITKDSGIFVAW